MFSKTHEYALRAVVCLAQNASTPLTTKQISELTKVPPGYLSKVLLSLVRSGVIDGTRGIGGGYLLASRPEDMTILQVINAIDPIKRITQCPLNLSSHGTNLCPLHHRLDQVLERAEYAFQETTIADLLADPSRSTPLCEVGLARKI